MISENERQAFKKLYRDIKKQENGGKEWEYDSNELKEKYSEVYEFLDECTKKLQ